MRPVVEFTFNAARPPHEVVLKLQGGDDWELNVWSTFSDLARIRAIRSAVWSERAAIRAGTSAGMSVFWAVPGGTDSDQTASVLIGHDDETWDIGFEVPVDVVEEIGRRADMRQLDD